MTTPRRHRSIRSIAGLVALASALGLASACDPSPIDLPTPSTAPTPRDPDGNPTRTTGQPVPSLSGTINGASIAEITAWWTKRWNVAIEQRGIEFSATVERYADQGRFSVVAIQANANRNDQPRAVVCVIVRKDLDDQAARHALVDGCLAAALRGDELQSVPAWLYAQTVTDDNKEVSKQFPRFTAAINRTKTSVTITIRTDGP